MLHDIILLLVGAAIICVGQLAQALADRIRGIKAMHTRTRLPATREPATPREIKAESGQPSKRNEDQIAPILRDVISALTGMGYPKQIASVAADESLNKIRRDTSANYIPQLETWTRAALKCCLKSDAGAVS